MKFEVEKNKIVKALGKVSKAIGGGPSIISKSIYFEIKDNIAKIVGFDSTKHISIITTIPVNGDDGKALIDASMLTNMLAKMNGDTVSIEIEDGATVAIIKCGKTKTTLSTADVNLFPMDAIEIVDSEPNVTIAYETLKALAGVSFAAAVVDNSSNAVMTAIDFKWKDGKFILTALDGHRVARRYIAINGKEFNVHVAAPLVKAALASLDAKTQVAIKTNSNAIEFNDGTTTAVVRVLDGNFFDVDRFETSLVEGTSVSTSKSEMSEMLSRMLVFSSSEVKKPVKFEITSSGISASLRTCIGVNEETIDATLTGDPITISVNTKFIKDVIDELTEETVTLRLGANGKSPIVIKRDEPKAGYFYIILPCVG